MRQQKQDFPQGNNGVVTLRYNSDNELHIESSIDGYGIDVTIRRQKVKILADALLHWYETGIPSLYHHED